MKYTNMKYTKQDVEFHSDGYSRPSHPAVNVRAYSLPQVGKVAEKLGCSEKNAERALGYAFNAACFLFWEEAQAYATEILGQGKVYQEGHGGGWLVVHDLADLEAWNAVDLAKWRKFEKAIKAGVKDLTSEENMLDAIRDNRWQEEGAEEYNFIDKKDGSTACIVDLKKQPA